MNWILQAREKGCRHAAGAGWATVVLASLGLLGWCFNWPLLRTWLPHGATMKFNTAASLLAAGLSLIVSARSQALHRKHRNKDAAWHRQLAAALALVPMAAGLLTLAEYFLHTDLGIDQLVLHDNYTPANLFPGRISQVAALELVLAGLALLIWSRRRMYATLLVTTLTTLWVSWFALLNIGFSRSETSLIYVRTISLPTCIAFLILSVGLLCLRPLEGPIGLLLSPHPAGRLARILIPTGIVIEPLLGWLRLLGEQAGWYRPGVSLSIHTTNVVMVLLLVACYSLLAMERIDRRRRRLERDTRQRLDTTEQALARANAYFEAAPGGMIASNRDGQILLVNSQIEQLFGYSREELVGRTVEVFIPDDLRKTHMAHRRAFFEQPERRPMGARFDLRGRRKDGTEFPVDVSLSPFEIDGRHMVISSVRDVTEQHNFTRQIKEHTANLAAANAALEHEVQERRATEDRLRHNDALLREAQRVAHLGHWEWDIDRDVVTWSEELYRIAGRDPALPPPSFAGHHQLYSAEHLQQLQTAVTAAVEHGMPYELELEMLRPDGTTCWIIARGEALRGETGKVNRLFGTAHDITDLKRIRTELEQLSNRLYLASASAEIGIWEWDLSRNRLIWDERMHELYGIRPDTFSGTFEAWFNGVHPDDRERCERDTQAAVQGERDFNNTFRVCWPDGSVHHIRAHALVQRDATGKPVRMLGTNWDITEAKKAESALRESEERFRNAIEYSPMGVALVGLDGRWLEVNRAICQIVGYTETELLRLTFQDITHPEDLNADLDNLHRLIAGTIDHYHMEKRYRHKQGQLVWVLLSVALVRDARRQPLYFVSEVQDINERKRSEHELRKSVAEKEALLKEIHHRVKNNMQVISSVLQLQSGYVTDPASLEIFRECQARIHTMAMVHERLYRTGNLATIDFAEHLHQLASLLVRGQARPERTLQLNLRLEPTQLDADTAIPLGLIANEMITNSLKHAFNSRTTGQLTIRLERLASPKVRLTVEDDGVGMPAGFDLNSSRTLGLRLIRNLTRQIRGELSISQPPGAIFTLVFEIPEEREVSE